MSDTSADLRRPAPRQALAWLAARPVLIAALVAAGLFVLGEVLSPGFAAYGQVLNVLRVASFLGIIAVGQTIVVLSGGEGIDLSVGKVATFAAILAARASAGADDAILWSMVLALGAGALIGLANGVGITLLRIPPLVMTLGMVGVVQGFVLLYTGGQPAGRAAPLLRSIVNTRTIGNLPGILWLWLAIAIVVVVLLRRTTYGRWLYAVGANRTTAALSGVPVTRTVIVAYVLSGTFAALGGVLLLGYTETVFLNLADQYMLPSVAAVVIGGTTLAGGFGGYTGTAIGAVVLTVLDSILVTLRMEPSGRLIVNGIVLLVLLSAYGRQRRLRQ